MRIYPHHVYNRYNRCYSNIGSAFQHVQLEVVHKMCYFRVVLAKKVVYIQSKIPIKNSLNYQYIFLLGPITKVLNYIFQNTHKYLDIPT